MTPNIVVTNQHVVQGVDLADARAVTEHGEEVPLELLASSPPDEWDYAVFRIAKDLPSGRVALEPDREGVQRGDRVVFSGFPHGVEDLLLQGATVSGPFTHKGFYIDGSVNGGNSGGPIVRESSGLVVGLVTQRRFLGGADLEQMAEDAESLRAHCEQIRASGSVVIMGIDFGQFAGMIAKNSLLVRNLIAANANAGIGVGFEIGPVANVVSRFL